MTSTNTLMVVEAVKGRVILMPSRGNKPVPATPTVVPRIPLYVTAVAHGDLTEIKGDEADKILAELKSAEDAAAQAMKTQAAQKAAALAKVGATANETAAENETEQAEKADAAEKAAVEQRKAEAEARMEAEHAAKLAAEKASTAAGTKATNANTGTGVARTVPKLT